MSYNNARNLAWEVLIRNNIKALPIDIEAICKMEHISLFPYSTSKSLIKSVDMLDEIASTDAFSFGHYILYDDTKPHERRLFSIAHEIGHVLMHNDIRVEPADKCLLHIQNPVEYEANTFASRLLMPMCVLQFIGVDSPEEIMHLCGVGYSAASLRFKRLCEVRKRSALRRKDKKYGTFLLSKLERQVYENFREFIEANKICRKENKDRRGKPKII